MSTFKFNVEVLVKNNQLTRDLHPDELRSLLSDGLWAATQGWAIGLPWVLTVEVESA